MTNRETYLELLSKKFEELELKVELLIKKTSPTNAIDKYEDAVPFHSKDKCENNFCCCRWCKDQCQCMQWYRDKQKEKQAKKDIIEQEMKASSLETGFTFKPTKTEK